jgi:hypothetical protein
MACENETNQVGAALVAMAGTCLGLEELPIAGQIACLASVWAYYNAVDALDTCRQNNGLAAITDHVQGIYADASALQQHTDTASANA